MALIWWELKFKEAEKMTDVHTIAMAAAEIRRNARYGTTQWHRATQLRNRIFKLIADANGLNVSADFEPLMNMTDEVMAPAFAELGVEY